MRRVWTVVGGSVAVVLGIVGVVVAVAIFAGGQEVLEREVSSSIDAMDGWGMAIIFAALGAALIWTGVGVIRGRK